MERYTGLKGGGFELLLDYNWILKKVLERCYCVAPGLLGTLQHVAAVCSNVIFCLWL